MSINGKHLWNEDRPKQAFKLALLGATDKQIADFMECNIETINYWKRTKSRFRNELKRGRGQADAEVAYAGYRKATGFEYEEEHISYVKGVPVVTTVTKYMPPDTMAIFKWLQIRGRDFGWGVDLQKPDIKQLNILNVGKLDLSGFDTTQLEVLEKLGLQQIAIAQNGDGNNS